MSITTFVVFAKPMFRNKMLQIAGHRIQQWQASGQISCCFVRKGRCGVDVTVKTYVTASQDFPETLGVEHHAKKLVPDLAMLQLIEKPFLPVSVANHEKLHTVPHIIF